jgi:acetyl-CoA acetyltransferase
VPTASSSHRTAVAGVGYTPISASSGQSIARLAVEASLRAVADAGVRPEDVDGVVTFGLGDTVKAMSVAHELGSVAPRWTVDLHGGGNLACAAVAEAAAAVQAGLAQTVVVYRAANGRSGRRLGATGQAVDATGARQFLVPAGLVSYAQQMAMWCRRYRETYRPAPEAYGMIAQKSRANASLNERAQKRETFTLDEYFDSPWIVDPFRLFDICLESDGACALVVTTEEHARDLARPPVLIQAAEHGGPRSPGSDLEDFLGYEDLTRNFAGSIRERLYATAGITAADLDFAEIYDCFTHTVVLTAEGMGLAPVGQGAEFLASKTAMSLDSPMPINTHGGLLSEGYLMGLGHITEAVLQLRGECGPRQVADARVGLVTAGAMMQGSALILTAA